MEAGLSPDDLSDRILIHDKQIRGLGIGLERLLDRVYCDRHHVKGGCTGFPESPIVVVLRHNGHRAVPHCGCPHRDDVVLARTPALAVLYLGQRHGLVARFGDLVDQINFAAVKRASDSAEKPLPKRGVAHLQDDHPLQDAPVAVVVLNHRQFTAEEITPVGATHDAHRVIGKVPQSLGAISARS